MSEVLHAESGSAPLVSVVLPAYDAGSDLVVAVHSVLQERDVSFELLVIDDGSTDGSVERLLHSVSDPRMRVLRQPNGGLSAALNRGLREARGQFIARMDADDISMPGRLAAQSEYLAAHPETVLVGGQIERLVAGEPQSRSSFPVDHDDIVRGLLARRHVLCHPAVMFRADAARHVAGYWEQGVAEDWDFFLKLSAVGRLANLPRTVLHYRFHAGGINATAMSTVRRNMALAIENHRRRMRGLPEVNADEFWAALGLWRRVPVRAEAASLTLYRHALTVRSAGRRGRAAALLAASAALWPSQAFYRLRHH